MIPGPRSRKLAARLKAVESPGVTTLTDTWPVFWERGDGAFVWDVDGNQFTDLTAAFGVMSVGHANPVVARAVADQATTLLHGMGDVHPPAAKVALLEALRDVTPAGLDRAVLGMNGADAVEAALKCAELVTGRPGVIAFEGAYHGLGGGALSVTARRDFRDPFAGRLAGATTFAEFPRTEEAADRVLSGLRRKLSRRGSGLPPTGALIVEPIQGRGGVVVPPAGFLKALRGLCDDFDLLLIADEIFTGLGRTGRRFAVEHEDVVPDLLCVGKALGGGMPISACVGNDRAIGGWPAATGEALHTSTFLGHPGSCAAAVASLSQLDALRGRAESLGERARAIFAAAPVEDVRGRGLMIGIELDSGERAFAAVEEALQRGVILLPSGERGEVLSITPPLTIAESDLEAALEVVLDCISSAGPSA